ncbi:hypothetical protein INR49_020680 [Caranx melampygus]|nr:hypothetical protein INR49_020680 [Caranx melampygus]
MWGISVGYSTVAINYVFEPVTKKKQQIPTPMPINELIDQLPIVQGRSRPIRVLNRLTIVMSDPSHYVSDDEFNLISLVLPLERDIYRGKTPEYRNFDLLAVHPTTEKLFHGACTTYEVDIISITVTEKLPFIVKRAPVNAAIDRGLVFEVSYAAAIRDSTMRRYTIANSNSLMECCKGRGVILSSAAQKALELRGPYDVTNLYPAALYGDAKEAVTSTCRSVLLHAETRKTASGIMLTMKSDGGRSCQEEVLPDSELGEAPAAKKQRPAQTE